MSENLIEDIGIKAYESFANVNSTGLEGSIL